jgi:hypothetical protein
LEISAFSEPGKRKLQKRVFCFWNPNFEEYAAVCFHSFFENTPKHPLYLCSTNDCLTANLFQDCNPTPKK